MKFDKRGHKNNTVAYIWNCNIEQKEKNKKKSRMIINARYID